MSLRKVHALVIAAWFVSLAGFIAVSFAVGAPMTTTQILGWVALGCVPPLVLLIVFRGAPPPTIGQVLYDVDHVSPELTRRLRQIEHAGEGR